MYHLFNRFNWSLTNYLLFITNMIDGLHCQPCSSINELPNKFKIFKRYSDVIFLRDHKLLCVTSSPELKNFIKYYVKMNILIVD